MAHILGFVTRGLQSLISAPTRLAQTSCPFPVTAQPWDGSPGPLTDDAHPHAWDRLSPPPNPIKLPFALAICSIKPSATDHGRRVWSRI